MSDDLTEESFNKLLAWLDPDRDQAAEKFIKIQLRLIRIFSANGCSDPERLATETFSRIQARIDWLIENYVGDPLHYFCAVARNQVDLTFGAPGEPAPTLTAVPTATGFDCGEPDPAPCTATGCRCATFSFPEARTVPGGPVLAGPVQIDVRSGGVLVYSVCSLEPEETEEIVIPFLKRHPEFSLEDARPFLPPRFRGDDFYLRATPHRHGTDGVFAARLKRG